MVVCGIEHPTRKEGLELEGRVLEYPPWSRIGLLVDIGKVELSVAEWGQGFIRSRRRLLGIVSRLVLECAVGLVFVLGQGAVILFLAVSMSTSALFCNLDVC